MTELVVVVGGAAARLLSTVLSATSMALIFFLSPMSLLPKDQKLEANERMCKSGYIEEGYNQC